MSTRTEPKQEETQIKVALQNMIVLHSVTTIRYLQDVRITRLAIGVIHTQEILQWVITTGLMSAITPVVRNLLFLVGPGKRSGNKINRFKLQKYILPYLQSL